MLWRNLGTFAHLAKRAKDSSFGTVCRFFKKGHQVNYFLPNICFTFLNPYFEVLFKPRDYGDYTPQCRMLSDC